MDHQGMESNQGDINALLDLVREFSVKTVVEVGTWTGATACRLADAGCSVTCIDWFKGQEDPADRIGHYREFHVMYGTFQKNCGDRLWRTIFPFVGQTHQNEAEDAETPWWVQGPFDMAFIDADHRYENCRADILRWAPCVRRGGIIACHDYEETFPGVMRAVKELRGDDFQVSAHSLAWWRV